MNSARYLPPLFGLLYFSPLVQAHPGHHGDSSGLFAGIVHSFMSMGPAFFLLAIVVGYGLWSAALRVTRASGGKWKR